MNPVFRFRPTESGFDVFYRGKLIGDILPSKEASGRHCFYLGYDDRKHPRTYRGKMKAAQALQSIHRLAADFKKKRWPVEKLILMSWDERPRASEAP